MATVIKTEPKKATQSNYRVYGKKEQTGVPVSQAKSIPWWNRRT